MYASRSTIAPCTALYRPLPPSTALTAPPTPSSPRCSSPALLSRGDVGEDLLLLALGHERAQARVLVERVARGELLRPLGELLHHLVVDGFLDQESRPGRADLALAVKDPGLGAAYGGCEVRVGEDDVRALAAELE